MKKIALLFLAMVLVMAAAGCSGGSEKAEDKTQTEQYQAGQSSQSSETNDTKGDSTQALKGVEKDTKPAENQVPIDESQFKGKKMAIIETQYGKIYFELFSKEAPETVKNFEKLADKGFYNGLTFHRVEPGFVAQGGDPDGTGTGGPGYTIKEELNSHKHLKGAVGMATQGTNTNTGGSQFYITLAETPFLDGAYTVFGQVLHGMEVVEKIKIGDKMDKVTVKAY